MSKAERTYELRFSGSGGQGLLLGARILAEALIREGRQVSQSQSYEPTSRGGLSRSDLVVAPDSVPYPLVTLLDWLVILDQCAADASTEVLGPGSLVLADTVRVTALPAGPFQVRRLPLIETARKVGNERVANLVAVGALVAIGTLCRRATLEQAVEAFTPAEFRAINREGLAAGLALA